MNFIKCPRCELNYIQVGEKMCRICLSEIKGGKQEDEIELCSICNAAPVYPGHDVCLSCLRDITDSNISEEVDADSSAVTAQAIGIDAVSTMDEIIPQMQDDLAENAPDMENEISLESVIEEEDSEDDDDDDLESDEK